jgi:hypothetical protein
MQPRRLFYLLLFAGFLMLVISVVEIVDPGGWAFGIPQLGLVLGVPGILGGIAGLWGAWQVHRRMKS